MRKQRHLLSEELVVLRIKGNVVLVYVLIQAVSAQNLGDLHQLVIVVVPMEERLLAEDL